MPKWVEADLETDHTTTTHTMPSIARIFRCVHIGLTLTCIFDAGSDGGRCSDGGFNDDGAMV